MTEITIIYDGLCPLCNAYVRAMRLKEAVGHVSLLDARQDKAQVAFLATQGIDINEGMVLLMGGKLYHGSDCIHMLALLSSRIGWFNRINAVLFSHPRIAQWLYPLMRLGRNALLRVRGIPFIENTRE